MLFVTNHLKTKLFLFIIFFPLVIKFIKTPIKIIHTSAKTLIITTPLVQLNNGNIKLVIALRIILQK